MKKTLLLAALSCFASAVHADTACYPVGTNITLFGYAVREETELSDGSPASVWMLAMDPPLCVIDRRYSQDPIGRIAVARIQLIGRVPPAGVPIAVTGTLSTRNAPQYYIMPTAMWATPPRAPSSAR